MYVHLPVCRLGKTQGFLVILIKVLSNKLNCLKACSQCAYMQQTHTHQCKFAMRIYQNPLTNNTSTNKNHPLDMGTGAQVVTCRQPAGYAALRLHNGGRDMLLLVLPLGRARCETSGVRKRGEPHSAATRLHLRARRVAYDRSAPTDIFF